MDDENLEYKIQAYKIQAYKELYFVNNKKIKYSNPHRN